MSYSILKKTTYEVYLSSADKVSGTNNNATYEINFHDLLPLKYKAYKMIWNLSTSGGLYKDSSNITSNINVALSAGVNKLKFASTVGMYAGMLVTGLNIPPNTYVTYSTNTASQTTNTNGIAASGSYNLTFGTSGWYTGQYVGMLVTGLNIQPDTYITVVSPSNYTTLSKPITGSIPSGTPISFTGFVNVSNSTTGIIPSGTSILVTGSIYGGAKVYCDFGGTSYSFDTSSKGPSQCVDYITRDPQGTTTSSNTLSCFYSQNCPKTMSRPSQNTVTIQIYNSQTPNLLFVNTDSLGNALTDCTPYNMTMEFLQIEDSLVEL